MSAPYFTFSTSSLDSGTPECTMAHKMEGKRTSCNPSISLEVVIWSC